MPFAISDGIILNTKRKTKKAVSFEGQPFLVFISMLFIFS